VHDVTAVEREWESHFILRKDQGSGPFFHLLAFIALLADNKCIIETMKAFNAFMVDKGAPE
jgi:hypothetical protein